MAKTRYSIQEARQNLSELVNRIRYGGERLILCRYGRDVAAVVSIVDLKRLEHQELLQFKPPSDRPPTSEEYGRLMAQKMVDELRAKGIDI